MLVKKSESPKYQAQVATHKRMMLAEHEKNDKVKARKAYWAKRLAIKRSGYKAKRRQIY